MKELNINSSIKEVGDNPPYQEGSNAERLLDRVAQLFRSAPNYHSERGLVELRPVAQRSNWPHP